MYEALKAWDKYATANYPGNMKLKRIAWDLTELAIAKSRGEIMKEHYCCPRCKLEITPDLVQLQNPLFSPLGSC